jgi:hypothetical protein
VYCRCEKELPFFFWDTKERVLNAVSWKQLVCVGIIEFMENATICGFNDICKMTLGEQKGELSHLLLHCD